jgi:hypothetical protein
MAEAATVGETATAVIFVFRSEALLDRRRM